MPSHNSAWHGVLLTVSHEIIDLIRGHLVCVDKQRLLDDISRIAMKSR